MTGHNQKSEDLQSLKFLIFRVLVMGEGKVLEDGSPKELLKKPMGFFSALFRQEQKA